MICPSCNAASLSWCRPGCPRLEVRPDGFYWVSYDGGSPEVWQLEYGEWLSPGADLPMAADSVRVLGARLVPP